MWYSDEPERELEPEHAHEPELSPAYSRAYTLDRVPIVAQVHQIRQLIVDRIDASIRYDELKAPQIYAAFIKPLVDEIVRLGLDGGTLYCLLANVDQFQKESSDEPTISGLCKTRAATCEIICTKLLRFYTKMEAAEALIFDFYPLSNGENAEAPAWLRISAIELAIHTECKHLLSHPSVVEIVEQLWNGTLTFDSYLNKSHRFNFSSREELGALVQSRKGLVNTYSFRDASMFRLSRLRVPKYRALFRTLSMVGFMVVYFVYSTTARNFWLFFIYGLGLSLDELAYIWTVGPGIYLSSLWNVCDSLTLGLFLLYTCLFSHFPALARDILATMGITLVPRVFGVFDGNESFSKMLISVRRMSIDLGVSWLVITMFSLGFWAAFAFSFSSDLFSPQVVAYDFVRIMFGYTGAGWDQWDYYHVFGKGSLLAYLFLTQFVVRPILTAVLSDTYSHVNQHATLEYNYLRALNTVSKLKAEAAVLFFYVPPLNIFEWVLYPMVWVLPYTKFLVFNRLILKATQFPLLFGIFIYESLSWRWSQRKTRAIQAERTTMRHIASLESLGGQSVRGEPQPQNTRRRGRLSVPQASEPLDVRSMRSTKARAFSNYALLDELFNPVLSVKYSTILQDAEATRADTSQASELDAQPQGDPQGDPQEQEPLSVLQRLDRLEETSDRIEALLLNITRKLGG